MRLWSLHPRLLDRAGLVACWREGLLARKVLEGKTKGYCNHPQLARFRSDENPLESIDAYLTCIYNEACRRNYNFDSSKINLIRIDRRIPVTQGQVAYEVKHLKTKLFQRDREVYNQLAACENIDIHPVFELVEGDIEAWEIV